MKYILKINNMYVCNMSIDSYDIRDAKRFSDNDILIIKPIIQSLLSIELEALAEEVKADDN